MLVDYQGKFLTQREYPQLATIRVSINDNSLILDIDFHEFVAPRKIKLIGAENN